MVGAQLASRFTSTTAEIRVSSTSLNPTVGTTSSSGLRDERLEQLQRWLADLFGSRDFTIAPASEDASFRRYFRVTRDGQSWIAMDAPPDKENIEPYIRIANMLVAIGVNAPHILQTNLDEGFLLNSDLGGRTYLDGDRWWRRCRSALQRCHERAGADPGPRIGACTAAATLR